MLWHVVAAAKSHAFCARERGSDCSPQHFNFAIRPTAGGQNSTDGQPASQPTSGMAHLMLFGAENVEHSAVACEQRSVVAIVTLNAAASATGTLAATEKTDGVAQLFPNLTQYYHCVNESRSVCVCVCGRLSAVNFVGFRPGPLAHFRHRLGCDDASFFPENAGRPDIPRLTSQSRLFSTERAQHAHECVCVCLCQKL